MPDRCVFEVGLMIVQESQDAPVLRRRATEGQEPGLMISLVDTVIL